MSDALDLVEHSEAQMTEEEANQALNALVGARAVLFKENRSWGIWLLIMGVIHVLTSGFLSAPWGIMLVLVGLGSFLFKSASMFIIYAVTLSWAAISNLVSLETNWIIFALLQLFFAYRTFRQFGRFSKLESTYNDLLAAVEGDGSATINRTATWFPWLGLLLGCLSIFGQILLFSIVIVLAVFSQGGETVPGYVDFLFDLLLNAGVLGFSVGLASVLANYRPRPVAIIGMVGGALTLIFHLALVFL
jgi:hypothetical protein